MSKTNYKCIWCRKTFSTIGKWVKHTRMEIKKNKTLSCYCCGRAFENEFLSGVHLLRRECLKSYPKDECKFCQKRFVTATSLHYHETNVCLGTLLTTTVIKNGNNLFTKKQKKELDCITLDIC